LNEAAGMQRQIALLMMALSLPACQRVSTEQADSYQHWTDQTIVRLGLPNVGIWPCADHEETALGEKVHVSPPIYECYKMQPSQHWRGIWVLGPGEHDEQFCPGRTDACALESRTSYMLTWNRSIHARGPRERGTYTIDFSGRRTTYPLEFKFFERGYVIVIDHLNSWKKVGRPPKKAGEGR
jgi:hypothetical protein